MAEGVLPGEGAVVFIPFPRLGVIMSDCVTIQAVFS